MMSVKVIDIVEKVRGDVLKGVIREVGCHVS